MKKKLPGDEAKRTYYDAINDELQKPIKCLGDYLKQNFKYCLFDRRYITVD